MSAHNEHDYSSADSTADKSAADEVRRAFAALSFEQKVATLLRVELDMVGDMVETVVNAASRAADEIADAFSGTHEPATDTTGTTTV